MVGRKEDIFLKIISVFYGYGRAGIVQISSRVGLYVKIIQAATTSASTGD